MSGRLKPQKKIVESGVKNMSIKLADGTELFIEIRVNVLQVRG